MDIKRFEAREVGGEKGEERGNRGTISGGQTTEDGGRSFDGSTDNAIVLLINQKDYEHFNKVWREIQ